MYEDRYQSGNREGWEFEYLGKDLVPSTTKRFKYHTERHAHWDAEAVKLEAEIREKGITLQERGVTGGVRFEASVDAALGKLLGEVRGKVDNHRSLQEQFEGFLHEFERMPTRVYKLKLNDLKFFGLVGDTTKFGDQELE